MKIATETLHEPELQSPPDLAINTASTEPNVKRGRLGTNLAANLAGFALSVAIGVWFTPYLIRNLGAASWGIIPLATTVTSYMTVVTIALNAAVGRFLTISLEQGDTSSANRCFNTSLFGSVALVTLLAVPFSWAALHAEYLIVTPDGQITATRWIFACAAVAFLVDTLATPFSVATWCQNRFDLSSALEIARKLITVALVVVLFTLTTPKLWYVGLALATAACACWIGTVWIWRYLMPDLHVSISHFDWGMLKSLVSFGGWVSVNHVGTVLFLGIDLLVVNRLFGPDQAGGYAAALSWSGLLRSIAITIASVFSPGIVYCYARNNTGELVAYVRRAVKCVGLLMALPIGLVCGFATPLLQTWLGPRFGDLGSLMTLLTIHLTVNLAVIPLSYIPRVTNRVRLPGVVTLVMGAVNLGLALLLAGPMGWGLYGVAAAGAIALTANNLLFTPIYAAKILGLKPTTFLRDLVPITCIALLNIALCKFMAQACDLAGWPRLIAAGAGVALVYAVFSYFVLLNPVEREMVRGVVASIGRKRI